MNELFPKELLDKVVEKYGYLNHIVPGKHEVTYTSSQLFETGIRVTTSFLIRDGNMIIYKQEQIKEHGIKD